MTSRIIAAGVLPLGTVYYSMSCLLVLGVLLSSVSLSVSTGDETGESTSSSSTWSSNMRDNGSMNDVLTTTESISLGPSLLSIEERKDELAPRSTETKDRSPLNGQEAIEASSSPSSRRDHHLTPPTERKRRTPISREVISLETLIS